MASTYHRHIMDTSSMHCLLPLIAVAMPLMAPDMLLLLTQSSIRISHSVCSVPSQIAQRRGSTFTKLPDSTLKSGMHRSTEHRHSPRGDHTGDCPNPTLTLTLTLTLAVERVLLQPNPALPGRRTSPCSKPASWEDRPYWITG